jgi:hypothetical protein
MQDRTFIEICAEKSTQLLRSEDFLFGTIMTRQTHKVPSKWKN